MFYLTPPRHISTLHIAAFAATQPLARDFDPAFDRLTEVTGFGSNPGALRMFKYVPADPQPALVVSCTDVRRRR